MADVTPQLSALAFPFLPADSARRGVVVAADRSWRFDAAAVPADAEIVIWGRLPESAAPGGVLARAAASREIALRTLGRRLPHGLTVARVHRLSPKGLGGGLRSAVRSTLRGGLMVEVTSGAGAARVLDAVAEAAGSVELAGDFYPGSGGAVLVRARLAGGSPVILRVGRAGEQGDPAAVADELERLARAGVPLAPRLLDRGTITGASWMAESALPGANPSRVAASLARQVADACARFPKADGPPTAVADDLRAAAERLPDRAAALDRLAAEMEAAVGDAPAILRHGDLWSGNLLVDRGTLTGMIDWDASHPAGVPGADLVQLLGTEARRRAHRHLGAAFLARPWRTEYFRSVTAGYWTSIGLQPERSLVEAAGVAWWATEVHHTVARLPHRASDEQWLAANVDAVLAGLGY